MVGMLRGAIFQRLESTATGIEGAQKRESRLAEDEPKVREAARSLLARLGYTVLVAEAQLVDGVHVDPGACAALPPVGSIEA